MENLKLVVILVLICCFFIGCTSIIKKKARGTDYRKAEEIKGRIERGDLMLGLLDSTRVDKMVNLYIASAKSGNSKAWYDLGMLYYKGIGVDQDADRAVSYFEQAADSGYGIDAWIKYIRIAYFADLTDIPANKIMSLVEELEEKDDSGEVYLLKGYMLYRGYAYEENWELSFKAHQKSVQKGNAEAIFELFIYYANGIGVEEDSTKALEMCFKAAEKDNVRALYNLGAYYAAGYKSILKNIDESIRYYTKAANMGHGKAAAQLAAMYTIGDEVEKDEKKAKYFYELALDNDFDVDIFFEDLGLEEIE